MMRPLPRRFVNNSVGTLLTGEKFVFVTPQLLTNKLLANGKPFAHDRPHKLPQALSVLPSRPISVNSPSTKEKATIGHKAIDLEPKRAKGDGAQVSGEVLGGMETSVGAKEGRLAVRAGGDMTARETVASGETVASEEIVVSREMVTFREVVASKEVVAFREMVASKEIVASREIVVSKETVATRDFQWINEETETCSVKGLGTDSTEDIGCPHDGSLDRCKEPVPNLILLLQHPLHGYTFPTSPIL